MNWLAVGAAVALAFVLGRMYGRQVSRAAHARERAEELVQLQAQNNLLRTLTAAPDITRSLFELAVRIHAIVPCDRVGIAMLTDDRQGYHTYTARLDVTLGGLAQPDLHFPRGTTIIDEVVAAREGRVVDDVESLAPAYLDVNVVKSSGYQSLVLVPLEFEGDALGTLNVVSKRRGAFSQKDLDVLRPVAEALAAAHGARRIAQRLARHQMGIELSELTFAFANDMSGAVQAIVGQAELVAKEYHDPTVDRELTAMLQQARRLREILNNMQRMTREHVATSGRPH